MPGLLFSAPNLAVVAYAEVDGVEGASTACNSGVETTRTGLGVYVVILPTTLAQEHTRDLIMVQLKQSSDGSGIVAKVSELEDDQSVTKTINVWSASQAAADVIPTRIDSSFMLLILRTTISPPVGAPT